MKNADTADNPLNALWQAPALIWMMLTGEGLAVVLTLALGISNPFRFFGTISLATQWILLLTVAELYFIRPKLLPLRPQRVAYVALLLLVGNAWLIATAGWIIFQPGLPLVANQWNGLLLRLIGIVLTAGLFGLFAFQSHWRARQLAVRAKQLQLDALQARIHPHFLFNTLNTGAALVRAQPDKAEQLLLDLSDLFRASLSAPREVLLSEELALTQRYLEIELLRLGSRLRLHWQVPTDIPEVRVPILSLQPLVENAVRHGVEPSPTGGDVEVELHVDSGTRSVRITIANDIPAAAVHAAGHNVGLASARERILAMAGKHASVETGLQDGRHVVTILLPLPAAG